jgi:hypothetical protein
MPPFDSNGSYSGGFRHIDYGTIVWWFNEALTKMPRARETNRCMLAGWMNTDGWVMQFKEKDGFSNGPVLYFKMTMGGEIRVPAPTWTSGSDLEYTRAWVSDFYERIRDMGQAAILRRSPFMFPRPWFGLDVMAVAPNPSDPPPDGSALHIRTLAYRAVLEEAGLTLDEGFTAMVNTFFTAADQSLTEMGPHAFVMLPAWVMETSPGTIDTVASKIYCGFNINKPATRGEFFGSVGFGIAGSNERSFRSPGTTGYFDIDVTPSEVGMLLNNCYFGYVTAGTETANRRVMGCRLNSDGIAFTLPSASTISAQVGATTISNTDSVDRTGLLSIVSNTDGIEMARMQTASRTVLATAGVATGALPELDLYICTTNDNGAVGAYTRQYFRAAFFGRVPSDPETFERALYTLCNSLAPGDFTGKLP